MQPTPIRCYWFEPTGWARRSLRRYRATQYDAHGKEIKESLCPVTGSFHNAQFPIGDYPEERSKDGFIEAAPMAPHDDPRWPQVCACGFVFDEKDHWQVFSDSLYACKETGLIFPQRELPPGSMFDAWWLRGHRNWEGKDGYSLMVILPDGMHWMVDGPASNCTMKEDWGQVKHHCWTRTGKVPFVTVGKEYGVSCGAGGGSIQTESWHGFLTRGWLHTDRNTPV